MRYLRAYAAAFSVVTAFMAAPWAYEAFRSASGATPEPQFWAEIVLGFVGYVVACVPATLIVCEEREHCDEPRVGPILFVAVLTAVVVFVMGTLTVSGPIAAVVGAVVFVPSMVWAFVAPWTDRGRMTRDRVVQTAVAAVAAVVSLLATTVMRDPRVDSLMLFWFATPVAGAMVVTAVAVVDRVVGRRRTDAMETGAPSPADA